MAQKAQKTLAQKNTATLNRSHLIALGVHLFYILLALLLFKRSLVRYAILSAPALFFQFWLERVGRPVYKDGELKRAGEDLEAKGLTEWMWDVVYWTWGNIALAALLGDWMWWAMLVPVLYTIWLAFTTYTGISKGMGGMTGGQEGAGQNTAAQSKRQTKLEARGGQKVRYR